MPEDHFNPLTIRGTLAHGLQQQIWSLQWLVHKSLLEQACLKDKICGLRFVAIVENHLVYDSFSYYEI